LTVSAAAVVVGLGAAAAQPAPVRPAAEQPDTTVTEVPASLHPSVSGDGRFVVYQGPAVGDEERITVFLRDRQTGGFDTELTRLLPSLRSGDSVRPVISADGCAVAVVTELALDLFRDDDDGDRWDVYRLLLPHCGGTGDDWELVSSTSSTGGGESAANHASPVDAPALSGAGTIVAFTHRFSPTAPKVTGVSVVDLSVPLGEPGRIRPVAGTPASDPDTVYNYRGLRQPALSDGGDVIAFTSDANSSAPVAEWSLGAVEGGMATSQVYVWDRDEVDLTRAVSVVSVAVSVEVADVAGYESSAPVLSADGRFVAFVSSAPDLVEGAVLPPCGAEAGCVPQVYRYDRIGDVTVLVSRQGADPDAPDAPVVAADAGGSQPSMTADGREIVFVSRATNLFVTRSPAAGGADDGDIVAIDVTSGAVSRVSKRFDGSVAPAAQSSPKLSGNGRVVVFDTLAGEAFGAPPTGRQVVAQTRTPDLTIDPLDVGTVAVGFLGPEWFATLVNRGPSAFTPFTIESTSPDFLLSDGGTCKPEVPVAPGGSCTIFVTMLPTKPGVAVGEIVVSEFGYAAATVTTPIRGFGGDPSLKVDLYGAELGTDIVVGALGDTQTFTLTNIGFFPTTVGAVTVTGEAPDDFAVVGGNCARRTLAVNDSCTIDVVFAPKQSGELRAVITAATGGGNYVSMQVNGSARYTPSIEIFTPTVRQGSDLVVVGQGFAPSSYVTLLFADGRGMRQIVATDAAGTFLAALPVRPIERPGNRMLVAQAFTGETTSGEVRIIPLPEQVLGAGPAFGG
jgi:Tol biopolymer transport system component